MSARRHTVHCSCGESFLASEGNCPECGTPVLEPEQPHTSGGDEGAEVIPLNPDETTPTEKLRRSLMTSEQVASIKPPDPLVKGLLALNSLAMLYGGSGIGKSFLAADFALHVAHGKWWQGRPVTPGPVLYVIAEGAASFGPRLTAWKKHHQLHAETHPIHWLPRAVNVSEPTWAGALGDVVAEIRPVLVVVDTLARSIVGADENSSRDIGRIIANLDHVRRAADSCVLLVHHSGKDSAAGARGSSALRGAMDTELELAGDPLYLQLKNTKQKDGPEASPVSLRLTPVAGTPSVVVTDAATAPNELPEKMALTLAALMDSDVPEGLTTSVWLTVADIPERTFHRHKAELLNRGLVVNISDTKTPKYRPAPNASVRVADDKAIDEIDWDEV